MWTAVMAAKSGVSHANLFLEESMLNKRIRALLNERGPMTVAQILAALKHNKADSIRQTLQSMPDTYIERWQLHARGRPAAVWACVKRPTNCPPPPKRHTK